MPIRILRSWWQKLALQISRIDLDQILKVGGTTLQESLSDHPSSGWQLCSGMEHNMSCGSEDPGDMLVARQDAIEASLSRSASTDR